MGTLRLIPSGSFALGATQGESVGGQPSMVASFADADISFLNHGVFSMSY